jgi:hypothetical protein
LNVLSAIVTRRFTLSGFRTGFAAITGVVC